MRKEEAQNKNFAFKISARLQEKVEFYADISGLTKSQIGLMGLSEIVAVFDEMFKEVNHDTTELRQAIKNPRWLNAGALIKPHINSMPYEERVKFNIIKSATNGMKGGDDNE